MYLATIDYDSSNFWVAVAADVSALTFAARRTLPFDSVLPQNPTVDAFFACINKWKLDENLFSKRMLQEYQDAIEGFRQRSLVHEAVIGSECRP